MSGIAIAGGNGAGKSTLGRRLAELTGFKHLDKEEQSQYGVVGIEIVLIYE